jgi:hypothetical protein
MKGTLFPMPRALRARVSSHRGIYGYERAARFRHGFAGDALRHSL